MWMINKAARLKDVDNRDLWEALNAMAYDQNEKIIKLQEKVVVNTSLCEVEKATSKEFSDRLNETLQRTIKVKKEAHKERQTNQVRVALKVANHRREMAKDTLTRFYLTLP